MSSAAAKVRGAGSALLPAERPRRAGGREGSGGAIGAPVLRPRPARASLGLASPPASAADWDRGLNQLLVPRPPRKGRDGGCREDCAALHGVSWISAAPACSHVSVSAESKEFAPTLNKTNAFQSSGGAHLR